MKNLHKLAFGLALGVGMAASTSAFAVEIQYWQYVFDTRVKAMDQLIANFEKANPDITVKQMTFPYADYQTNVIAAQHRRQGPGRDAALLRLARQVQSRRAPAAAAAAMLSRTTQIEKRLLPHRHGDEARTTSITACRPRCARWRCSTTRSCSTKPASTAKPPQTLDELVAAAKKTTKIDGAGNITSEGITLDFAGQDHQWWREVLVRQFGGEPYNDDYNKVDLQRRGRR